MAKSRLPELIKKARTVGELSFRDIVRRSGNQITLASLNEWDKKTSVNMTTDSVCALARGLGEHPTVVFEAVIGESVKQIKEEFLQQILADFASLPAKDREELRPSIEMLRREIQRRLDRDA